MEEYDLCLSVGKNESFEVYDKTGELIDIFPDIKTMVKYLHLKEECIKDSIENNAICNGYKVKRTKIYSY